MPTTLYLPSHEDTEVVIKVAGKGEAKIDIFDLEQVFLDSEAKAGKMSTTWKQEFPLLLKAKTGLQLNAAQSVLLWEGVRDRIDELKKSLLEESTDYSKPALQSRRGRKKKSV